MKGSVLPDEEGLTGHSGSSKSLNRSGAQLHKASMTNVRPSTATRTESRFCCMSFLSEAIKTVSDAFGRSGTTHLTIVPEIKYARNVSDDQYSHRAIVRYDGNPTIDESVICGLAKELQSLRDRDSKAGTYTSEIDFYEETWGVLDAFRSKLGKSGVSVECVGKDRADELLWTKGSGWKRAPEKWGLEGASTWQGGDTYQDSEYPQTAFDSSLLYP